MTGLDARTMVVESLRKVAGATAKPALRGVFQDPNSNVPIAQLGFDSLDAVEWCMEIETASGIELDPAELAPLVMLDDLVLLIAQRLGQTPEPDGAPPMRRIPRGGPLPLSFAQESIWSYCQVPDVNAKYLLFMVDRIDGPLNADILRDCLTAIVGHHEILRTAYPAVAGKPAAVIHAVGPVELPVIEISSANKEEEIRKIARQVMARTLDLARGPLARFALLRVNAEEHWLLRVCHHILWDEWSSRVLLSEIARHYELKIKGDAPPPPDNETLQYVDYAAWQRSLLTRRYASFREKISWWMAQFRTPSPPADMPFIRAVPRAGLDPSEGIISQPVEATLAEKVSQLCQNRNVTVYAVWLAALAALLAAEGGQGTAAIGTYMNNRRRSPLQNMLGYFLNFAVLNLKCDPALTFPEWARQMGNLVQAAESHSDIPHELLRKELEALHVSVPEVRLIFGAPMAQARADTNFARLRLTRPSLPLITNMPWGITINLHEFGDTQELRIGFDANIYEPAAIRGFASRLCGFLGAVLQTPVMPMGAAIARCATAST